MMGSKQRRRWPAIVASVAGLIVMGAAFALCERADSVPSVPLEQLGLVRDHAAQAGPLVASSAPFRIVGAEGVDNTGKNVRLWDHALQVRGSHLPNYAQQIGDCVSFGAKNAVEYLQCVQLIRGPPDEQADEFRPIFPPFLYGASRHQIGGDKIRGDGSVGAWAAEAAASYGVLNADHSQCPSYSASVAKEWGQKGPPPWALEAAKSRVVKTVSPIKSANDGCDAICNGYPVTIASSFGTTAIREQDGRRVGRWNATWYHQMCIVGYDGSASSGKRYFYVLNSWGPDAHPAPLQNEPPGGFWITWEDFDRIVKEGDSWAYSSFDGFPSQEIDFSVFGAAAGAPSLKIAANGQGGQIVTLPHESFGPLMAVGCVLLLWGLARLWGNVARRAVGAALFAGVALLAATDAMAQPAIVSPPPAANQDRDPMSFAAFGVSPTATSTSGRSTTSSRATKPEAEGELCFRAWGLNPVEAGADVATRSLPALSFAGFGIDAASAPVTVEYSGLAMETALEPQCLVFWRENCADCLKEVAFLKDRIASLGWTVGDQPDADFRLVNTRLNSDLRVKYGIDVVPQLVYLDQNGRETKRVVGYSSPMNFTAELIRLRGKQK